MSAIYYNKETDTAFRVRSKFGDSCWCVTVKTNNGKSKMYAKEFAMNLNIIADEVKAGKLFALYDAKTISRDISLIRAGLTPPVTEKSHKPKKLTREIFTMKIGSLIDENPMDYVGIYDKDGYLIGHEYNNVKTEIAQEVKTEEVEVKNLNQLNLFN